MSTEGAGSVGLAVGSPVIIGLAVAVGTGVMVQEGVMWCGKKLREHAEKTAKNYTAAEKAKYAADHAHVREVRGFLAMQLDSITMTHAYQSTSIDAPSSVSEAAQQALAEAITRARQAMSDARQITRVSANAERDQAASRLMLEIENGRGLLSARIIAQAEDALEDSAEVMLEEITTLKAAWKRVATAQTLKERQRRETQHLWQIVTTQLTFIEAMLHNTTARSLYSTFTEQRRAVETFIQTSKAAFDSDISDALQQAQKAHEAIRSIAEFVSTSLMDISNNIQSEVNTFRGTLTTLNTILEEAISTNLIAIQQAQPLTRRIASTLDEVQSLTEGSFSATEHHLRLLRERVALLKQEVFSVVEQRQQRNVAETIVATLAELGFQSAKGNEPALKENGDVLRVEALRIGNTQHGERDDKTVSFDIGRDCNLAYDFSGYVGDTCVQEAERVFAALRANGIYILDEQAMQYIQTQPAGNMSINRLNQPQLQPHLEANKLQAELAEHLRNVLEQMQYGTITQNVVGGCIELEAFNGSIGYRVVLPSDGSTQVFKDATYSDVSTDLHDPIVAEAHRLTDQEEGEEDSSSPERKRTSTYKPARQTREN